MEPFHVLEPLTFQETFLKNGVRTDQRTLDAVRPTSLQLHVVSHSQGSAMARQGHTTILATIKAELFEPTAEKPEEGSIVIGFEPFGGSISDEEQESFKQMQTVLSQMAARNAFVPLESLCIEKGALAWVLYCSLQCIEADGAMLDTCLIALNAALSCTKLPQVMLPEKSLDEVVNGEQSADQKPRTKAELVPVVNLEITSALMINCCPVALTFTCYKQQQAQSTEKPKRSILIDPSKDEELLLGGGSLCIIVAGGDPDSVLCGIHYLCGQKVTLLTDKMLEYCVKMTRKRHAEVTGLIREASV